MESMPKTDSKQPLACRSVPCARHIVSACRSLEELMTSDRSALAMLAVLSSLLFAATAQAELGPPPDFGPRCTRADAAVNPPAGDVPANWRLFSFARGTLALDYRTVRLVRVSDGSTVPFAASNTFSPLSSLVVGEEYDLYHPICAGETPAVTRYRAIAPIPEPSTLGTITVSELYASNYEQGIANRQYFVEVRLATDPAFAVEPWASAGSWETEVDGAFPQLIGWPRTSPIRLPVDCSATNPITPGDHVFRGVGFMAVGVERFGTPTVSATVAPCASAQRVDNTTLRPLTADEIAYWDTEPTVLPPPPMDAMVPADGGLDGGRAAMMTARDTNTNCAVGIIGAGRARYGVWSLLLVALVAVWRRPRRA